jgi:hypothetical protein
MPDDKRRAGSFLFEGGIAYPGKGGRQVRGKIRRARRTREAGEESIHSIREKILTAEKEVERRRKAEEGRQEVNGLSLKL